MNNTIFSGSSRYANDFQQVIDRSVAIASLPLVQLQHEKTILSDQSSALSALDGKFSALQTAIAQLESATTGSGSLGFSVSNAAILKPNIGSGATAGTWSVEVTGLGVYSNTMSQNGLATVSNPDASSISTASSFTLIVNSTQYTITPSANTLTALVQAINSKTGTHVQASMVNIGGTSSPDYRLSIQSDNLGPDTIQLKAGAQELMNTPPTGATQGSLATYKVNGLSTELTSNSRTLTLAPGLTIDLLDESAPGEATTVTLTRTTSGVSNALTSLVTAYNAAVDELDKQRGDSNGALAGQSVIYTAGAALRGIGAYSGGSGSIDSLTELGLTFDDEGKLSFDTSAFATATTGNFNALLDFMGSTTGSGFLRSATDALDGLEDTTDGAIKTNASLISQQIAAQDKLISDAQEWVDTLRQNLSAQMAAADALIASLEQRVNYITLLFETMRIASEQYK